MMKVSKVVNDQMNSSDLYHAKANWQPKSIEFKQTHFKHDIVYGDFNSCNKLCTDNAML